jgi:peroxiredoxin
MDTTPDLDVLGTNAEGQLSLNVQRGQPVVLLFLPASPSAAQAEQLTRYAQFAEAFAQQGVGIIGISARSPEARQRMVRDRTLRYPLLSDPYGAEAARHHVGQGPLAYLQDADGVVHNTYDADRYPDLPAPAIWARTERRLSGAPRAWPVSPHRLAYRSPVCPSGADRVGFLGARLDRPIWFLRRLPLLQTHPSAQLAAEAAEAAGALGHFRPMHDRLFAAAGARSREHPPADASELGLDVQRFAAELDERRHQQVVQETFAEAVRNRSNCRQHSSSTGSSSRAPGRARRCDRGSTRSCPDAEAARVPWPTRLTRTASWARSGLGLLGTAEERA